MAEGKRSPNYSSSARLHDTLLFFAQSVRHPLRLGVPLPSCERAAHTVSRELASRPAERVVELGAGTGSLTRGILRALRPGNMLLCVEKEKRFCELLASRFNGRVKVVHGDAWELNSIIRGTPWEKPDVIVCSVPLTGRAARRLCEQIAEALPNDGLYLQLTNWPAAMKPFFKIERTYFFLTNVPPERLHCAIPKVCRSTAPHPGDRSPWVSRRDSAGSL